MVIDNNKIGQGAKNKVRGILQFDKFDENWEEIQKITKTIQKSKVTSQILVKFHLNIFKLNKSLL